jgi:hypothetical protein
MKDYSPTHFQPFTSAQDAILELEAMSIQYGLPIEYLVLEFVVDGVLQIDISYIPPAGMN